MVGPCASSSYVQIDCHLISTGCIKFIIFLKKLASNLICLHKLASRLDDDYGERLAGVALED
jgi:hypothetical protein